jgi:hypothetical protein
MKLETFFEKFDQFTATRSQLKAQLFEALTR